MSIKKTKTTKKTSKIHVHISDIPRKYFPRTKGNKSKEHLSELLRTMRDLIYTNNCVQYSGQVCSFNVRSIPTSGGFDPQPEEVFRLMQEFVYHYENYCFRIFAFRERLFGFTNEILELGYVERDTTIKNLKIHPVVRQAKLLTILDKFNDQNNLGKIIKDRHSLTHKLYYGKEFDHYLRPTKMGFKNEYEFKKWCSEWKKEITNRSSLTNKTTGIVYKIAHDLASNIIEFKGKLRKSEK
ncbi:hypothetical protein IIA95_03970 [Patescibacteria group bacterium]|nr:hypothetical protein [Patescibacteria group bacterium]